MDVRVDAAAMQDIVTKAIFDGLTEEKRAELVQGAIRSLLLAPAKTQSYGRDPRSPMQEAFENAASIVAQQIARERLTADETFKAGVESMFKDVAAKLFADDVREKIVDKIADAVVTGLGERYR